MQTCAHTHTSPPTHIQDVYLLLLLCTDMPRETNPPSSPLGVTYKSTNCRVDPEKNQFQLNCEWMLITWTCTYPITKTKCIGWEMLLCCFSSLFHYIFHRMKKHQSFQEDRLSCMPIFLSPWVHFCCTSTCLPTKCILVTLVFVTIKWQYRWFQLRNLQPVHRAHSFIFLTVNIIFTKFKHFRNYIFATHLYYSSETYSHIIFLFDLFYTQYT